ncbi:MAG: DNA repair protein RadA, partial [Gemmatimonadota bacterium]|nr:DNA repair protein RadA [Gemmatimonadota bacterium]
MSPKGKTVYRCSECGAEHPKWAGRCESCGEWNSLVEEPAALALVPRSAGQRRARGAAALGEGGSVAPAPRLRDV